MRKLALLAALASLPSLASQAQAKRNHDKTDPRLAVVEDEPVSKSATQSGQQTPADPSAPSGARMDATIHALQVGRAGDTGDAISRAPSVEIQRASDGPSNATDSAVLDELIARQMRRNAGGIDACVKDAVRRHPSVSGTVQLAVVVSDKKVQSVHVASDSVHDIDLDACLVKAGLGWKLQLAAATFTWPVTLSPSASR